MKNENNHKPAINNKSTEIELVKDKSSGYFKVEKNKEDYKDKMKDDRLITMLMMEDVEGLNPVYKDFIKLVREGYSLKAASCKLGYTPRYGSKLKSKIEKLSLKHGKIVKKAHKIVVDVLDGKESKDTVLLKNGRKVTVKIKPSLSQQIDVAKMVYDRYEPIQKGSLVTINQNFHPVDLDEYSD